MIFFRFFKKKEEYLWQNITFYRKDVGFWRCFTQKKEKTSTQHNWQVNFLIFNIWICWYIYIYISQKQNLPNIENYPQFELLMKAHNNITSILPFFSFVFSLFFFSLSLFFVCHEHLGSWIISLIWALLLLV